MWLYKTNVTTGIVIIKWKFHLLIKKESNNHIKLFIFKQRNMKDIGNIFLSNLFLTYILLLS